MLRTNTAKWINSANRWQINVQKDGVRKTFTCAKEGRAGQRECNAKADKWLSGNVGGSKKVKDVYDQWLEEVKLLKGTGSYVNYESFGRIHIIPQLGQKKVDALSEQDFQTVLNSAYRKGLAYKTLTNIRGCMQTFLKFCRKSNLTTLHLESLEIGKDAKKGTRKILQPHEIKFLLECDDDSWYVNAYRLFVLTGMREGELVALKKEDCADGRISIKRAYNRFGEMTQGKTANAKRIFLTTALAGDVIKNQLDKISHLNTEYLFPKRNGEITSGRLLYRYWGEFTKRYQLTNTSVNELRHTFVSVCKSVPLEFLKTVVGHSPDMDTFGQYGHLMDGDLSKARSLIENEFSKI